MAQPGSAFGSGPKGRRFKSSRPDNSKFAKFRSSHSGPRALRGLRRGSGSSRVVARRRSRSALFRAGVGGPRRLRCAARREQALGLVCGRRTEAETFDFLLEVVRRQVAVDLGREARILMAHDSLHGGQVGAAHEQERRRRVAKVVEADLPDLADGEELERALRAATEVRVARGLAVPTALAPALVNVAGDETRPAHGPTEHLFQLRVLRQHAAVLGRKDQLGRRGRDRAIQVNEQLGVDRDGVDAAALRDVAVVRAADQDEARLEVHVRLPQREQLALAHAGVDPGREQVLPLRRERGEQRRDLGAGAGSRAGAFTTFRFGTSATGFARGNFSIRRAIVKARLR